MLGRLRERKSSLVDLGLPGSEGFRALRLSLDIRRDPSTANIVLVTSAEAGEGKSTVACNFARVSSLNRTRVLLIDCDLRSPSIHTAFRLARSPGLVEMLAGEGDLTDFVWHIPGEGKLDVLTAGHAIPRSGDLVSSPQIGRLLEEAAQRYDLVIVDSPPVLAVTDAEGLASHSGVSVVLVVSPSTRRRTIVKAVRRLRLIDANVIGTVLNQWGKVTKEYYY